MNAQNQLMLSGAGCSVAPPRATRSASTDAVQCLRQLLADAEAGKVVAVSFTAMNANRDFFYGFSGEAEHAPSLASAMAATLLHGAMKRVFGED